MPQTQFKEDDRVRHTAKPQWGVGTVLAVQATSHEGQPCQRVTVRFDQAGKKTLSTAFARLSLLENPQASPREGNAPSPTDSARSSPRPLASNPGNPGNPGNPATTPEPISADQIRARLISLPDSVSDPFRPLADRLGDTLDLYRFSPDDRSLLDWASIQTGLRDTLSILTRHDLEQQFGVFRVALDRHLRDLLEAARRAGLDVTDLIARAPAQAQHALRRINHGR